MKFFKSILILLAFAGFTSCEDQIDVPVQTGPIRLVVEASLDWEKGTSGNLQIITLSESTPFYDTTTNTAVTGASVQITNDDTGQVFVFQDLNNGDYSTNSFVPIIGNTYTLRIDHEGEVYTATDTQTSVADITDVFQTREDGFDTEILEVHVTFTDPIEEGNNYLFKFHRRGDLLPNLEDADDEFVNGNEIDWWFEEEEDEYMPGQTVDISVYGISRPFYDYIRIIVEQAEGVDLFSSTPVPVRGNCVNETNPDNYAFGFFRLTEVSTISYTFTEDE